MIFSLINYFVGDSFGTLDGLGLDLSLGLGLNDKGI
jgi:hypothetical protein